MNDATTPAVRFEGLGASAGAADAAARLLAERLNHWSTDNPGRHILQLSVQTAAGPSMVEMTALIAYTDETAVEWALETVAVEELPQTESAAVAIAEEIVAEVQAEHGSGE